MTGTELIKAVPRASSSRWNFSAFMYASTYRPESTCPTTTSVEFRANSKKALEARVTKSMVSGAWMNSSASGDSRMVQSPLSRWLTSSFMVPHRFSRPYPHWGLG